MHSLAIDTSGPFCSLALARIEDTAPAIIAEHHEPLARGHGERLVPAIEALLAKANVTYGALERLAVGVGPGQFTGVRVAVAAARALALALDLPCHPVTSLQALAARARCLDPQATAGRPLCVLLEARRGRVFTQGFAASGLAQDDIADLPLPDALAHTATGAVLVTCGLATAPLQGRLAVSVATVSAHACLDAVAQRVAGDALPGSAIRPCYVRPPDAVAAPRPVFGTAVHA